MNSAVQRAETRPSLLGLVGENSRPDIKKVRVFLSFTMNDVAQAAGVSKKAIQTKTPTAVLERFAEIARICEMVAQHFGDVEKAARWFKEPNPLFGDVAPRDVIRLGRYDTVNRFVTEALSR